MQKKPKILVWDIESSNLAANYGFIICISYKWHGESGVKTISVADFPSFKTDPTNDFYVVREFSKVYNEADVTVAHYGQKFDLPMVNTKLIMHGLPTLSPKILRDTWRISKDKLRLNSNRLETLISALNLKYKKTPLSGPIWVKAMSGDHKAIKYVEQHCIADVNALDEAYKKLVPLVSETAPAALHTCDPKLMVSNGSRVCAKKVYTRLFCKGCGGWFKGETVNV